MSESSPLLQLFDALNRCVDPAQHTSLISDALNHAGLPDVPVDRSAFRQFISGPLQQVAQARLGDGVATELTWTLMRMTSVRAPSSRAPSSNRPHTPHETLEYTDSRPPVPSGRGGQTIEYTDDVFAPRIDVLVIDPTEDLFDELSVHLEARDYRVARTPELGDPHGFTRDAAPRLVIMNVAPAEALRLTERLRRDLDRDVTKIMLLTAQADASEGKGIDRVMPRATLAPIVEAVAALVGSRSLAP